MHSWYVLLLLQLAQYRWNWLPDLWNTPVLAYCRHSQSTETTTTTKVDTMSWITSIYWLLDIPASFLVGYAVLEASSANMCQQLSVCSTGHRTTWGCKDLVDLGGILCYIRLHHIRPDITRLFKQKKCIAMWLCAQISSFASCEAPACTGSKV